MMDWFEERILMPALLIVIVLIMAGLIYVTYDAVAAETFSLRKDAWTCTRSHSEVSSTFVQVDKIMIPIASTYDVCDQWSRK